MEPSAGKKGFPVWIGDLHSDVSEKQLKQRFSVFGSIISCHIRNDKLGRQKNSAYVNFTNQESAENAAKKLAGYLFNGKPIITKGPSHLLHEGYLKMQVDFRPLTDCAFFVNDKVCKKGDSCPYRHYQQSKENPVVCPAWAERKCHDKHCPKRHPGGLHRKIGSNEQLTTSPLSSPLASFNGSDCDSDDFEILTDSDDASDNKELAQRSSQTGSSSFAKPVADHCISKENQNPSEHISSGSNVMESARNALQRSSFMQSRNSPFVSTSSDDTEEYSLAQHGYEEDYTYLSQGSSGYGLDEMDDDLNLSNQPVSFTRLLSLTDHSSQHSSVGRHSDYEGDIEKDASIRYATDTHATSTVSPSKCAATKLSISPKKTTGEAGHEIKKSSPLQVTMTVPQQLEPVGVFWDIENCQVPVDKSAFAIATKMKREFFRNKREAEFMCVCDINKERKEVTNDLNKAHVTLVHVSAVAKNAADDKLRHSLRKFARTFPPPSTVVLVSGDVNFSPEMNDLRHVHNITTIIVHNRQASEALKVCAHTTICYEDFIEDVGQPQQPKPPIDGMVIVKGLPSLDSGKLRTYLSRLADNCGGKVASIDRPKGTAKILFRSPEWAAKAQKRMNGEDVFGSKITVEVLSSQLPRSQHTAPSHQPLHSVPPSSRPMSTSSGRPQYQTQAPPLPRRTIHPAPLLPMQPPQPRQPLMAMQQPLLPKQPLLPMQPPVPRPIYPNMFPMPGPPRPYLPRPPYLVQPPSVGSQHPETMGMGPGPGEIHPSMGMLPQHNGLQVRILVTMPRSRKLQEIIAKFTEVRLKARVKSHNPEPFFYNFSTVHLVSEFDFAQTAKVREEKLLLQMYEQKKLKPSMVHKFSKQCMADIDQECKRMQLSWVVAQCAWGPEEEEERRIRSNVVRLLHLFESHWAKWEEFKNKYMSSYHNALSELVVHCTCQNAVELLGGAGGEKEQVVLFSEFSPTKTVSPSPMLMGNIRELLSSRSRNRIKLLEFVEAYCNKFGPLPGGPTPLQDFLVSSPEIVVKGMKAATMVLELRDPLSTIPGEARLMKAAKEFTELLKNSPENELPLKRIQQEYQTYFHKSIRVTDVLPGETGGMRALLHACPGIKLTEMRVRGELFTIVGLESPPPPPQSQVPEDVRESFKKMCIELLSSVPGQILPISRFPSEFSRRFQRPLCLADFKVKKLAHLLYSIPEVVQVTGESEDRRVQLVKGQERRNYASIPVEATNRSHATSSSSEPKLNKTQFQILAEKFLYESPGHQLRLDMFLTEWEKRLGFRLVHYCGHSKFINLLEDTKNIQMIGTGAQRMITLVPIRLFACEMKELLKDNPKGIIFPQIVPAYKEKFKKTFDPATYNKTKLISVLEEIRDVVKITGEGPRRVAHLVTTAKDSSLPLLPPTLSTPLISREASMQAFLDGVTSLLLTKKNHKLTLEQLSASYYKSFQHQINWTELGCSSLIEAISKLPNIKISGEGAKTSVQLNTSAVVGGDNDNSVGDEVSGSGKNLDDQAASKDAAKQTDSKQPSSLDVEVAKPVKSPSSSLSDSECKRICSEINRLLLCHSEHTMTLNELQDCFEENEDPVNPSVRDLQYCVTTYAQEKGSPKFHVKKVDKTLILVSLIPTSAQWKLAMDLLFLFVYKPVPTFSLSLKDLLAVYCECYGHVLNPNVYNCNSVNKLLQVKTVAKVIKFEPETNWCVVKPSSRHTIFSQLACELLFKHAANCTSLGMFVSEWRNYFGVPLTLSEFGVESLEVLAASADVSPFIKVVSGTALSHLVLTARGLYQEQLRHLLMVHRGRIPLDLFVPLFCSEFAEPTDPEIIRWLQKKEMLPQASQVVNLAGLHWMVWAPTGRPYPDTRSEKQQMVAPEGMEGNPDILLNPSLFASVTGGTGAMDDLFAPIEIDSDLIATLHPSEVDLPPMITMEDISPETVGIPLAKNVTAPSANQSSLELMPAVVSGEEGESETNATITSPEDIMKMMEAKRRRGDKIDMEPIIDFLGDLSARELERVEGSIPKLKPSRSRSGRQKPSLAICFPGQSIPPSDVDKPSLSSPSQLPSSVTLDEPATTNTTLGVSLSTDSSNIANPSFQDITESETPSGSDYLTDEQKLQARRSDLAPSSPPSEWPAL